MSNIVKKVEDDITNAYGDMLTTLGLDPVIAKAYFTLFFSDEPLGMDEISKKTGYSKSTVCNFMSMLEKGLDIERFKKPGSKKVYFRCEHDLTRYMEGFLLSKLMSIRKMIEVIGMSESELGGRKEQGSSECLGKIRKLRQEYEGLEKMMVGVLEANKLG